MNARDNLGLTLFISGNIDLNTKDNLGLTSIINAILIWMLKIILDGQKFFNAFLSWNLMVKMNPIYGWMVFCYDRIQLWKHSSHVQSL